MVFEVASKKWVVCCGMQDENLEKFTAIRWNNDFGCDKKNNGAEGVLFARDQSSLARNLFVGFVYLLEVLVCEEILA